MESQVRKLLKFRLPVRHGQSSKACEAALKRCGFDLLSRCSPNDRKILEAQLPDWCDDAALRSLCWPVLVILKRVDPAAVRDPMPEQVPAKISGKRTRGSMMKGFDYYCYLHKEELEVKAAGLGAQKRFRKVPRCNLLKKAGGAAWTKLDKATKAAYAIHAADHVGHRRNATGQFEVATKNAAEASLPGSSSDPIAAAPSLPGSSSDPPIAAAPSMPASTSDPPVTPVKRKKSFKSSKSAAAELLYDTLKTKIEDEETPTKEKQILSRAVRCLSGEDERLERLVKRTIPGVKRLRAGAKAVGRPKGSQMINDENLRATLQGVSAESSVMHGVLKVPVRTLECSKTRASQKVGVLSRSQMCHRLRHSKVAIAPFSCQRGRCDACYAWQQGGRKMVVSYISEGRQKIGILIPGYWAEFDEKNQVHDSWELSEADSVEWLESLLILLRDGSHMPEARGRLSPEDQLQLRSLEATMHEGVAAALDDVRNYSFHLALKRTLDLRWADCWYRPAEHTTYMLWDHMVL